jgi:cytochrome d ubiquinol oxidase subunit II
VLCDRDGPDAAPLPHAGNTLDIYNGASSQKTWGAMMTSALPGVPVVLACTACIYWIFPGKVKLDSHSY